MLTAEILGMSPQPRTAEQRDESASTAAASATRALPDEVIVTAKINPDSLSLDERWARMALGSPGTCHLSAARPQGADGAYFHADGLNLEIKRNTSEKRQRTPALRSPRPPRIAAALPGKMMRCTRPGSGAIA